LRLRADGAFAIGVDITPSCTTIAISDLAGRLLEREAFAHRPRREEMVERVIATVQRFAASYDQEKVAGIGVSLPGLVDPVTGRAIYIPWFDWRDWAVVEEIGAATGFDVMVDNDANAAALAALWFGRPELTEARDFIMVLVAEGIGTGIIFDGQIYRGERGAAGEFGHMIVGERALIECSCGNYECWEAFSSERAAIAHYLRLTGTTDDPIKFPELIDRALAGEQPAVEALAATAHYLGIGISNLIVGLSPETVVVGGRIARAWPLIGETISQSIQRSIRRGISSARILPLFLGDQPTLLGAITLVLSRKFGQA
jgi:predicted NBD/HSP70 family sugar kinase